MKPTLYKLLPAILLMALQEGCQPVVEKPAIENCLIKKIDQIEINNHKALEAELELHFKRMELLNKYWDAQDEKPKQRRKYFP